MQMKRTTPALLALLLAATLAACSPAMAPLADAAPQEESFIGEMPAPRLGFSGFTAPDL